MSGCYQNGNEPLGLIKEGNALTAESATQEGFCAMS
jgi:hypothetical protein